MLFFLVFISDVVKFWHIYRWRPFFHGLQFRIRRKKFLCSPKNCLCRRCHCYPGGGPGSTSGKKFFFKLNSYLNTTLIKKPFFKPHRTKIQRLCHYFLLLWIERKKKLRRCLSNHKVKIVFKPCDIIGKKLAGHKDSEDLKMRQKVIYPFS